MPQGIETAAVLGAGVMGSAIAAHLAGAGIRTHLLDIVPPKLEGDERKDPKARNAFADGAIKKALKARPAPFFDPDVAGLIQTGNFDDHLDRLADCDLVIEAVVENLDIKKSLFEKVAEHLGDDAVLASNTSGLSIASMNDVLPDSLKPRFMVMHFFNPVRYMRLLEIVPGPNTRPELVERMASFGEFLGKGIVYGKDTANFVANRIGVYGMMKTMHLMMEDGYSIEEVDKIAGPAMGRPRSAVYKTADVVGLDTLVHVAQNCYDALPNDECRDTFKMPEFVHAMVKAGALGRKSGAGFYKKEGKEILVIDPKTGDYRAQEKIRIDSLGAAKKEEDVKKRIAALVKADDRAGTFAWKTLSSTLVYAARRMGEIADDVVNIDRAMRWGFNWDLGPFEVWDAIGVKESVARMKEDGLVVPEWVLEMLESGQESFYAGSIREPTFFDYGSKAQRPVPLHPKHLRLAAVKENKSNIVKENMGASLLDLGDGVLAVEFHTKMNTLDNDVISMLDTAIDEAEKNHQALLIANDGEHFCAGANIMMVFMAAQQKEWGQIDGVVKGLQDALQRIRYANVPVVAAPFQYTLGGGAEVAMAADACHAHCETYMGLVEVGVGLVPAGGGCLRVVERFTEQASQVDGVDLLHFIGAGSLNIAMAKVATSADEARRLRYLQPHDTIALNRDFLLYEAKQRALGMAKGGYRAPRPKILKAAGLDAAKTIGARIWGLVEGGYASEHDALIANKIAHILCGGQVAAGTVLNEQHYLDLEREAFLSLCGEEKTQARIQHMLMNNKPLRN